MIKKDLTSKKEKKMENIGHKIASQARRGLGYLSVAIAGVTAAMPPVKAQEAYYITNSNQQIQKSPAPSGLRGAPDSVWQLPDWDMSKYDFLGTGAYFADPNNLSQHPIENIKKYVDWLEREESYKWLPQNVRDMVRKNMDKMPLFVGSVGLNEKAGTVVMPKNGTKSFDPKRNLSVRLFQSDKGAFSFQGFNIIFYPKTTEGLPYPTLRPTAPVKGDGNPYYAVPANAFGGLSPQGQSLAKKIMGLLNRNRHYLYTTTLYPMNIEQARQGKDAMMLVPTLKLFHPELGTNGMIPALESKDARMNYFAAGDPAMYAIVNKLGMPVDAMTFMTPHKLRGADSCDMTAIPPTSHNPEYGVIFINTFSSRTNPKSTWRGAESMISTTWARGYRELSATCKKYDRELGEFYNEIPTLLGEYATDIRAVQMALKPAIDAARQDAKSMEKAGLEQCEFAKQGNGDTNLRSGYSLMKPRLAGASVQMWNFKQPVSQPALVNGVVDKQKTP